MKSTFQIITASIIQGSEIGPAAIVVNAADLKPLNVENVICKFADDIYIIIDASEAGHENLITLIHGLITITLNLIEP